LPIKRDSSEERVDWLLIGLRFFLGASRGFGGGGGFEEVLSLIISSFS